MNDVELAKKLLDELAAIDPDGTGEITTKSLIGRLKGVAAPQLPENFQLAQYDADVKSSIMMWNAVIDYGKYAINCCLLINGGASVAMLTFIGNLMLPERALNHRLFALPLIMFVIGVLAAAIPAGGAYLCQYLLADKKTTAGYVFLCATAIFVITSYVLFALGIYCSYHALI
jgi:hypothetical protein